MAAWFSEVGNFKLSSPTPPKVELLPVSAVMSQGCIWQPKAY